MRSPEDKFPESIVVPTTTFRGNRSSFERRLVSEFGSFPCVLAGNPNKAKHNSARLLTPRFPSLRCMSQPPSYSTFDHPPPRRPQPTIRTHRPIKITLGNKDGRVTRFRHPWHAVGHGSERIRGWTPPIPNSTGFKWSTARELLQFWRFGSRSIRSQAAGWQRNMARSSHDTSRKRANAVRIKYKE